MLFSDKEQPSGIIKPAIYMDEGLDSEKGKPKPLAYYKQAIGLSQLAIQHAAMTDIRNSVKPSPKYIYDLPVSFFRLDETDWVELESGLSVVIRKVTKNPNPAVAINEVDYAMIVRRGDETPIVAASVPYEHTEPQTIHFDTSLMDSNRAFVRERDIEVINMLSAACDRLAA
jgi:hypothetical protein